MIDATQDLLAQTGARIDEVTDELACLQTLRDALAAFIDSPSREAGDRSQTPAGEGATVGVAPPTASLKKQPPASETMSLSPASQPCPNCERSFTPNGLAIHRSKAHGIRPLRPDHQVNGKPDHPAHSEKFLCGVCSRPFPTRIARDDHQAENACAAVPTRPPVKSAPFVLPGSPTTRSGGLGQ